MYYGIVYARVGMLDHTSTPSLSFDLNLSNIIVYESDLSQNLIKNWLFSWNPGQKLFIV